MSHGSAKLKANKLPSLQGKVGRVGEVVAIHESGTVLWLCDGTTYGVRPELLTMVGSAAAKAPDGVPTEEEEARAFIAWAWGVWDRKQKCFAPGGAVEEWPELRWLTHVANEGSRSRRAAGMFKLMGANRGVFDYFLDVPRNGCHGWRGELKRVSGGSPSKEQKEWLAHYQEAGYHARIHLGWEAMRDDLLNYLRGELQNA